MVHAPHCRESETPVFQRTVAFCAALLSTVLLGGCRVDFWFSSDDDDFWTDATGVWQGTLTETGSGGFPVTGLIIAGQLRVFGLGGGPAIAGSYAISRDSLSAPTTHYAGDGTAEADGTLNATVSTRSWISGSFTTTGGGSGTLSLRYDALTARGASLAVLDGNWFVTDGGYSMSLAIDAAGTVSGSDTDGCVYAGRARIIDPTVNVYGLSLSASGCAADGSYSGHGALLDTTLTNGRLVFMASNPDRAIVRALDRT